MDEFVKKGDVVRAVQPKYAPAINTVLASVIMKVPLVDAVEVIRCKECAYYYAWPDDYRTCHKFYEIDGATKMMPADGYCSEAERAVKDDT